MFFLTADNLLLVFVEWLLNINKLSIWGNRDILKDIHIHISFCYDLRVLRRGVACFLCVILSVLNVIVVVNGKKQVEMLVCISSNKSFDSLNERFDVSAFVVSKLKTFLLRVNTPILGLLYSLEYSLFTFSVRGHNNFSWLTNWLRKKFVLMSRYLL